MLVAGVDSSTQSCKVVIREVATGRTVRTGKASHPDGTEVHPDHWFTALNEAIDEAGGFGDVAAISIAGQQHGMVVLDSEGRVIRPALLWNDTRSAQAALDLIAEFGADYHVNKTGSAPVASFTITKLRWLRDAEPENAAKVAAVALPHDWLTWRLRGFGPNGDSPLGANFDELTTDRSEASGTGYFNPATNEYERELLIAALGNDAILPRVFGPTESVGLTQDGQPVGAGGGDNAMAALGLGAAVGDAVVSIGTSGTVFTISAKPVRDVSGTIAGFADCTGNFLPITVTLNAARLVNAVREVLDVDFDELADLALQAEPGSLGMTTIPFFEGERTPNLPEAKGSIQGLDLANFTRANLARSVIEGMLCGLQFGLDKLQQLGIPAKRLLLIGGSAQNSAVQQIAATIFGLPIEVPEISEYVAEGAAVQAAWVLTGEKPAWKVQTTAELAPQVSERLLAQYRDAVSSYVSM